MTRDALCLTVEDLSAFARNLHKQLAAEPALPGHLSLLNMLARAAGFRNYQHFRAVGAAAERIAAPEPTADMVAVEQALRQFGKRFLGRTFPVFA